MGLGRGGKGRGAGEGGGVSEIEMDGSDWLSVLWYHHPSVGKGRKLIKATLRAEIERCVCVCWGGGG